MGQLPSLATLFPAIWGYPPVTDCRRRSGRLRRLSHVLAALGSIMIPTLAVAHHSFANFDMEHESTLTGIVKELKWTNPHAYVLLMVADETGVMTEWLIEFGSQASLARKGWTRHSWKPGDKVKVVGHLSRDGSKLMTFTGASDADNRPYPPAPNP